MVNIFTKSKYLIRLDDASHFSDLEKWFLLEQIFDENKIKPLIAVIPDNKDPNLMYSQYNETFWEQIKKWELKGWSIAMHGYTHEFHNVKRSNNLFPFYDRSEFTQLSLEKQRGKIKNSISIFHEHGINPKFWVAPGHCFDQNTLEALRLETSIRTISDGISFTPYVKGDFLFIPQQLWNIKEKGFGFWTICLHPDTMSFDEIKKLSKDINKITKKFKFINWSNLNSYTKDKNFLNKLYSKLFWFKYDLKLLYKKKILKK